MPKKKAAAKKAAKKRARSTAQRRARSTAPPAPAGGAGLGAGDVTDDFVTANWPIYASGLGGLDMSDEQFLAFLSALIYGAQPGQGLADALAHAKNLMALVEADQASDEQEDSADL